MPKALKPGHLSEQKGLPLSGVSLVSHVEGNFM